MKIAYIIPLSSQKIIPGVDNLEYEKTRRFISNAIYLSGDAEIKFFRFTLNKSLEKVSFKGFEIIFLPVSFDLRKKNKKNTFSPGGEYALKLINELNNFSPDIIHSFGNVWKNFWFIWLISKMQSASLVVEHCGGQSGLPSTNKLLSLNKFSTLIHNFCLKTYTKIIATNQPEIVSLLDLGVNENNIISNLKVLNYNTDSFFFKLNKEKSKSELGFDLNTKYLLYVGAIEIGERSPYPLLPVIKRLSQIKSNYHLLVIGDGKDRGKFETYVEKYNLKNIVTISEGWVNSKEKLNLIYNASDIFTYPFKLQKGHYCAVIEEAKKVGLPIITYGDHLELTDGLINYVEPYNTKSFCNKIKSVSNVNPINSVDDTKESSVSNLLQVYENLING